MYVTFNLLILEKQAFFENSLFTLPRQPIKLRESDKSLITVENYSTKISVEIKFYYPYDTVEISNFHFSHYKSMQVCQVSASSSFRFLRRRILNIFRKFTLYVAPSTN